MLFIQCLILLAIFSKNVVSPALCEKIHIVLLVKFFYELVISIAAL